MGLNWTEDDLKDYYKRQGIIPNEPEKKKKSKYSNNKTTVAGVIFDSQKEASSYEELKLQLMVGEIAGFCRQAEFILQEGFANVKPITYRCDWIVFHNNGTYEIRDDKGMETEVFKIKHKMFMDKFPRLELKVVK
jgi:hypothetical protein